MKTDGLRRIEMWRKVLLVLLTVPAIVWAEESLAERAATMLASRTVPAQPEWTSGVVRYFPALWHLETSAIENTGPDELDFDGDPLKYETIVAWYLLTENLPALKQWSEKIATPRELAQAELAFAVLEVDKADSLFRATLTNPDPVFQRLGKIGLSKVLQKKQKYQEALDLLVSAWTPEQISDEIIFQAALCKQRLGETSESMDLLEEVLKWNSYHEFAHYYLGNGYARKNYTELESTSPYLKCDGSNKCARDYVVDGTEEWMQGEFESALEHFFAALELVPEYGRAHNGVAKCLEQMRLRENIYRDADQEAFDGKPFPQIPMIEKYIMNWESLSERHRKQVAISVEPWKAYIPVLVASGSLHYIKPLHEKLSEVPGLETIADQRISYDSRLWDDVRGCGGFTTVTGVEDVERSIYNRYNTVLHELTHQVHGVFPPEDMQKIEDLYREASAKDAAGEEIFVSRYQGSSVWEYFAEGMNSYFSPRRNEFDTREITKERLFALDSKLVELLEYYMSAPNVEACYTVGLITAADNEVELGKLETAMEFARKAESRDPHSEVVLRAISRLASLADEDSLAVEYAERLLTAFPDKAASYQRLAWSKAFADGKFEEILPLVKAGLAKTAKSERIQLTREVADWEVICGNFAEAVVNYTIVLSEQETDDEALRGYAEALFWAGHTAKADSVYQVALKRRSGLAGLRLEYGRMLLLAGQLEAAKRQFDEAELLKPGDGRVAAHMAWYHELAGDHEQALNDAIEALEQYPDDALVQTIAGHLLSKRDRHRTGIPSWRYNPKESSFEVDNFWDATTVALWSNGLTKPTK